MAKTTTQIGLDEDFQVPLLNVFRSAAMDRDSQTKETRDGENDTEISTRQIERRDYFAQSGIL